jgi:hypothetical protein
MIDVRVRRHILHVFVARGVATALFATVGCAPADAAVTASTPDGFTIEHRVVAPVPPAQAWARLVSLGKWWEGSHSYSGDAANLSIDPRAGGCWCERLPSGGSVEHARIIQAVPGRLLRASGGFGPLQSEPVAAILTVTLKPVAAGTEIAMRYAVAGPLPGGVQAFAGPVDTVLTTQFDRLAQVNAR